jgi:hypothetical protein
VGVKLKDSVCRDWLGIVNGMLSRQAAGGRLELPVN